MSVIIRHKTIGDFDLYMSYTANTRDLSYSDRHFSVWMTYKSYGIRTITGQMNIMRICQTQ